MEKGKERTGLNLQTSFTFADFLPSNNDDDMSSGSGHVSSIRLVQQDLLENDHFLFSRGIFEKNVKIIFRKYFPEFSVLGGHMHWLGRLLEASISLARKHLQGTTHSPTFFKLF
jgi:hypothetical protein